MIKYILLVFFLSNYLLAESSLKNKLYSSNEIAYIPSQCFTKTTDKLNENILHNPCFACHNKAKKPNFAFSDEDLQEAYDFPEAGERNPWRNLFKDRTKEVNEISDKEILKYIRQDNYKDTSTNTLILQKKLSNIPKNWDFNNNGKWDGYIPDFNYNFDSDGFDRTEKNEYSGWRAFAYYPFLGTFWPTNGSTDDVFIRLAKPFMQNKDGQFDIEVYKINLLIVESLIKQKTLKTFDIDENKYKVDLNQNGKFDIANEIVFKWEKPQYNRKTKKVHNFTMSYIGKAKEMLENNKFLIAPGLYPLYTEFLHSVRYIDIDKNNEIKMAARMKELRYAKKTYWVSSSRLASIGLADVKEKYDFPERAEVFIGDTEKGLSNKRGWRYQGFIEDNKGELRPQNYEETMSCMGCHGNIGVTVDSTFVFPRKFEKDTHKSGWYHWSQKGLKGIKDKKLANGDTEYVRYLKLNNAGDEFRQNQEIKDKFFVKNWEKDTQNIEKDLLQSLENPNVYLKQEWKLKKEEIEKVKKDITHLILPSPKRALQLNKAYKVIVNEQSYIYGRDAHIKPTSNVHKKVKIGQKTQLEKVID